ncbi:glycosyltransferase [Aeromonas sp. 600724]|uniref:glycosyltransferase n=1 Tax=Aeromonas sp. 600724 TaxID=2712031 RepID=UPI003BA2F7B6
MPTIIIMKARQRKKITKKNNIAPVSHQQSYFSNEISVQSPHVSDEKHLHLLKENLVQIHNDIKEQREHIVTLSQRSLKKQYDYLLPLILENKKLADTVEKSSLNKSVFNSLREHVYTLERQKYELQVELEKEIERTKKAKNSISFLLGNTLIMFRKNNESILSLFRKLYSIKKIAKSRRLSVTSKSVQIPPKFISNLNSIDRYKEPSLKLIPTINDDVYIPLNKEPSWFSFTPIGQDEIKFSFSFSSSVKYKDVLARLIYIGRDGSELSGNIPNTYISATVGRYVYLDTCDVENKLHLMLTPPSEVGTILIGLQTWQSKGEITILNGFNMVSDENATIYEQEEDEEFQSLKDGVSIVVPSYKGNDTIPDMLNSILEQTISKSLIQVIIIVNGEDNSSLPLYEEFKKNNQDIDVFIHHDVTPSASNARNIAISYADRKFTIFLDNDDMLTESYIQSLYNKRSTDSIVISGIHDLNETGNLIKDNSANKQYLLASTKAEISYNDVTAITTMIACKLLPTHHLKKVSFVSHLRSGEDVVFFCDYMSKFKPKIRVVPESDNAYYIRRITQNSVSRQNSTFDFCVRQRLQVIKELKSLQALSNDKEQLAFIQSKINAQCTFIKNFLSESPEYKEELILELKTLSLEDFSYEVINRGKSKSLVISYCFPPYVDTSACVMAKRLRAEGEIVDVVYNNMSKVRNVSNDLNLLVNDLIEQRKIVNTPSTFANWSGIYGFAIETLKWATRKQSNYEKIYSRAMWPASHFAAFLVKQANPALKWTAEFSDPILWDIKSQERYSKLDLDFIKENVLGKSKEIDSILLQYKDNDNLYFWCELLPYLFADTIVFTCTNQRDYMLSMIKDVKIKNLVSDKSKVSKHPTLDDFYYNLGDVEYPLNSKIKNIGYFGAFYSKRNLDDVLNALKTYKEHGRKNIMLHVFTEQKDDASNFVNASGLSDFIKVNGYLDYLDFLKLIKGFDCLIVNDAEVSKEKGINPYLPSKVSDYMGSGTKIWALCEENSELSKLNEISMKSIIGDSNAAYNLLVEIENNVR